MNAPPSPWEQLAVLGTLVRRAARRAWIGAIALALGLVVTAIVVLTTKRIYRSETVLLYERGVQSATLNRDPEAPRQVGQRLKDMVTSRQRLQRLIEQMNLYPQIVDKLGMVEAVEELQKRVIFGNEREGATFRVSYDGESRQLAKEVLETLVGGVIAEDNDRRKREAEDTRRFLDTERKHADEEVKIKGGALSEFLAKHPQLASETGSLAAAGGLQRAADRDRVGTTGTELASLEMQAAQLEQSIAAAGAPVAVVGGRTISAASADPQLLAAQTRAQAELQTAQRDLADKQTHLTNEHPDVRLALRRVAAAEGDLRRATAALAAWRPPATAGGEAAAPDPGGDGGEARTAALRRALTAVRQQISAVRGRAATRVEVPRQLSSVVAIDTEWTRLNREVSEAHERQSQLEAKQFQAQLAATLVADGQGGRIVIADPPFLPMRPISGKRLKFAMVGGVASLMFAISVLGLLALFDDRLYNARDIEALFDDGIVVVIPKAASPRLTANVDVKAEPVRGDVQSG